MQITVNGKQLDFDGPLTGEQLLDHLGIPAAAIVAEVNRDIVRRDDFVTRALTDGDVIELVTVVGGG